MRKLTQLGYSAIGNGKKGQNYRIIIKTIPDKTEQVREYCEGIGVKIPDSKYIPLLQLLYALKTDACVSCRALENYCDLSDTTIKKYLVMLEEKGIVVRNFTKKYYVSKKRILHKDDKRNYLTDEEKANGDYLYIREIKLIPQRVYDECIERRAEYLQEIKYDEFIGDNEKKLTTLWEGAKVSTKYMNEKYGYDEMGLWMPYETQDYNYGGGWYSLNTSLPFLLDEDTESYYKIYRGNFDVDFEQQQERMERWEEDRRKNMEKKMLAKKEEEEFKHQMEIRNARTDTLIKELLEKGITQEQIENYIGGIIK